VSLDDQIRQTLDRALTGFYAHLESELRSLVNDFARVAAEDRHRAVAQATDAAVAEVRQKAHAQLAQIREAAQKHTDELRRSADAQIHELKRTIDETRSRAQADVEDARRLAQTQVDDVQRAMEQRAGDLQARLAEVERRLTDAMQQAEETRRAATAAAEETRRAAAAAAEELIVEKLAAAAAEHDRKLTQAVDEARASSRQLDQEQTGRLVDAIRRLDDARSLGEVLEVLAQSAAREAERVAVLIVRGDRLTGWSVMGFGDRASDPRAIDMTQDAAGVAGMVVRAGLPASRRAAEAADGTSLPSFAQDGTSRDALALPVLVGGATVAVVYADAAASDRARAADRWPAILDVVTRHAGKVLEALTVQHAVGLSLPRPLARASHDAVAGLGPRAGAAGTPPLSHDRSVQ
jgi:hypothetical protein